MKNVNPTQVQESTDFLVIGAGYAGLTISSLLHQAKKDVILLESHYEIGGCASYFKRQGQLYDVGATTLSGFSNNGPITKLCKQLDLNLKLKKIPVSLVIKINNKKILRYSNHEKWLNELNVSYPDLNTSREWNTIHKINKTGWQVLHHFKILPPVVLKDFLELFQTGFIKLLKLAPFLLISLKSILNRRNYQNSEYNKMLSEQLLISTQSTIEKTPALISCLGLAYHEDTHYCYGGITKLGKKMVESMNNSKNVIRLNHRVISIEYKEGYYFVKLIFKRQEKMIKTKYLISSIPVFNLKDLFIDKKLQNYFSNFSKKIDHVWGAFTLYFSVKFKKDTTSLYYQIHTDDEIPICKSKSYFVSLCPTDDDERTKDGFQTITISTHCNLNDFNTDINEHYKELKKKVSDFIMSDFKKSFSEYEIEEITEVFTGTPKTFERYTLRKNGTVGGIPHSFKNTLFNFLKPEGLRKNLFFIGDTSFPGQGIVGVIRGAQDLFERLKRDYFH